MLEEALNRLNKMGIHKVLMTCNPYNDASKSNKNMEDMKLIRILKTVSQ